MKKMKTKKKLPQRKNHKSMSGTELLKKAMRRRGGRGGKGGIGTAGY